MNLEKITKRKLAVAGEWMRVCSGIELCRMLKKGQHVNSKNAVAFEQFYALAA